MGREILFRGKSLVKGWLFGDLLQKDGKTSICVEETDGYWNRYIVDEKTVCQYTGLTDKNGRKIFEGDVVRDIFNASVVGIVRYGDYRNTFNDDEHGGHVGFYIEWKKKRDLLRKDLVYWVKSSEFIGNIFDNPELLNQ